MDWMDVSIHIRVISVCLFHGKRTPQRDAFVSIQTGDADIAWYGGVGAKILRSEILFHDFAPACSFPTGCSACCISTSSSWWTHIIPRKSADPVQQIETLLFLVTFWPPEVICGFPGIWSDAENCGFKRSKGEEVHLPEKYSSSKHSSDHVVFEQRRKTPYLACWVWEKSLFRP